MSEQTWKPRFRTEESTVTKVLRSPAFVHSRERSHQIIDDPIALRRLGEKVQDLDYSDSPLSAVEDRVSAAFRFLYARADHLDIGPEDGPRTSQDEASSPPAPGGGARERLVVAALHYLVTPVDLVPDVRIGGYLDDVMLLSWVFGAAVTELETYLVDDPDDE